MRPIAIAFVAAWSWWTGVAYASDPVLDAPPEGHRPGTLAVAAGVHLTGGHATYRALSDNTVQTEVDADQQGVELSARYWAVDGLAFELELRRPDPLDRFGLAEDWTTDRLCLGVTYVLAHPALNLRAGAGVSAPTFDYDTLPDTIGAGGWLVGGFDLTPRLELLGTATAGRSGSKGDLYGAGLGLRFHRGAHAAVGRVYWAHVRERRPLGEHPLIGGGGSYAYRIRDQWGLFAGAAGYAATESYSIGQSVFARPSSFHILFGLRYSVVLAE